MFQIQQEFGHVIHKFDKNAPYDISVLVYFDEIYNKSWPATAQQKYKKRDATNVIKLLEDTLAKAIGVDDANFLRFTVEKRMDKAQPHIEIVVKDYEEVAYAKEVQNDRGTPAKNSRSAEAALGQNIKGGFGGAYQSGIGSSRAK
jgi:Holliday junction resolvase RusA-like endonuclease